MFLVEVRDGLGKCLSFDFLTYLIIAFEVADSGALQNLIYLYFLFFFVPLLELIFAHF